MGVPRETKARGGAASFNMNPGQASSVRVKIFNQVFNLRSESNEEYLLKLAEFVDEKMQAISSMSTALDYGKIATLVALNIADELHRLKAELSEQAEAGSLNQAEDVSHGMEEDSWSYMDILERETTRKSRMSEHVTARLKGKRMSIEINEEDQEPR